MAYKECMKCRVSVKIHKNIFGKGFNSEGHCVGCANLAPSVRKGEDSILPEIAEAMRIPATSAQVWNGKDIEF